MDNQYLDLVKTELRRAYGSEAQRVRVSIQKDILDEFAKLGIIELVKGTSTGEGEPTMVLGRGGYGSPFLQTSSQFLLGLLSTEPDNFHLDDALQRIKAAIPSENWQTLANNLRLTARKLT